MSTHVCFSFLFPNIRLMQLDDGAPETAATADNYYYYPEGAYYHVTNANDQE